MHRWIEWSLVQILAPIWCQTIFYTNDNFTVLINCNPRNRFQITIQVTDFNKTIVQTMSILNPSMFYLSHRIVVFNTLRPRQNGRHFTDDIFKWILVNENVWIPIKLSMKFVPKGPISNIPALVQITAWRRLGDKPLSEPMVVSWRTHICVTRPQWVNTVLYLTELTLVPRRVLPICDVHFICWYLPDIVALKQDYKFIRNFQTLGKSEYISRKCLFNFVCTVQDIVVINGVRIKS